MPVVLVTAGEPVLYSLNNGLTMSKFEAGVLYEVPDYAARGMIEREWAKVATPEQIEKSAQPDPPIEPAPAEEPPKGGRKAKP
jgi:hypothetical protein